MPVVVFTGMIIKMNEMEHSEKMCKSQTVQVKAPEIRIGGSIKFYDKQKDFGFIAADHG